MKPFIVLLALSLSVAFVNSHFLPDCTNSVDGLYSLGECNPRFLTCSGGVARIMDCPPDLVYNERVQICDWRHNLIGCEGSGDVVDASGDGSGSGDGGASGDEDEPELLRNVCENLDDGVYSSGGCTSYYFICTSNSPRFLTCPTPLFYDSSNQQCSWKVFVEECKEDLGNDSTDLEEASGQQSSGEGSGENTPTCDEKPDGIYPIDVCATNFLTCSGGVARLMGCPNPLVFNPTLLVCDWPRNVHGCAGLARPKAQCEEDGYFSFGQCSTEFTACTNGRAILMFCPAGLKFSQKTQMCDYEQNVLDCQEAYEDELRLASEAEESSGLTNEAGSGDKFTPCLNMDNGLYALECSPRVLSCQNGHEDIFECPPTLVFNEQSLICDFPETSLKCQLDDVLLIRDSSLATYDCAVDGFFSDGLCSNSYHQCSSGQVVHYTCANSNDVFSVTDAACVDASLLPQCQ